MARESAGDGCTSWFPGLISWDEARVQPNWTGAEALNSPIRISPALVLVVSDEPLQRAILRSALLSNGFHVADARSEAQAIERLSLKPDVLLLSLQAGGAPACRALRARTRGPIIFLGRVQTKRDEHAALEAGATEYVPKPFDPAEVAARVQALAPRRSLGSEWVLELEDREIDLVSGSVRRGSVWVQLTSTEFKLLRFFVSHAGEVLTHDRLMHAVWPECRVEVGYLPLWIRQLRRKIERNPDAPRLIVTEPLTGYQFLLPGPKLTA
jgi:two-component system KDP operon response regulator KdpE